MLQLRHLPILCFVLVLFSSTAAWGSSVAVSPVRVHLSAEKRSELLLVTNSGAESIRFQITAHAWSQTAEGEMILKPTSALVFFPSLFEVAPGKARRIRVGTQLRATGAERSYRIVIEELPPPTRSSGVVRVLTRLNLPVFFQLKHPEGRAILKTQQAGGKLAIELANRGNAYLKNLSLRVVARAKNGEVIFEQTLPAWYVLAGGRRSYSLKIPAERCGDIRSVVVVARTESETTNSSLTLQQRQACSN